MSAEIKHRFTGEVICTGETVRAAALANMSRLQGADLQGADLQGADLQGADLQGADLRGADLQGADLQGAYLQGAYVRGADLRGADLQGADLQGADLRGANLQGADLRGAKLAFTSHDLIAEILRRAAGDDMAKLKVAGYILICREQCWSDFLRLRDPLAGWAMDELAKCLVDGDGAPQELREWKANREQPREVLCDQGAEVWVKS